MSTKILSIVLSLGILLTVIELARRERLSFKYAAAWLIISSVAAFFAVFDNVLNDVSSWLGFELISNFIFFALLCGFVFLSLLLTIFLCRQNIRNDKMAQKLGILEHDLEQVKKKIDKT